MKEMGRYLLGVVMQSLQRGSPAEWPIFNRAIECPRAVLELYISAWYKSHEDATLSYMDDALCRFQTFEDVFLLGQAGKNATAKANAMRTKLLKKRQVLEETQDEGWMASRKWCKMNAWWDYISHEIDVSKELDADFNFLMIHLMSHWVQQTRWYWAFQQYSAERHERAHNQNLKDGWNASNHNLNYLPQVIIFQHRILRFEISVRNPSALIQSRENSAATSKVPTSSADLVDKMSSQS